MRATAIRYFKFYFSIRKPAFLVILQFDGLPLRQTKRRDPKLAPFFLRNLAYETTFGLLRK
jgi:hypothetical protein